MSVPTTKRSWQVARAQPAMALTGASGTPATMASTAKLFQPQTLSAMVRLSSPQSGSSAKPASTGGSPASTSRMRGVRLVGRHSGTRIWPRASVIVASAWTRMIAGSARSPPKFPE